MYVLIRHLFQSYRVEMEQWKKKNQKRKGVYVSQLVKGLPFKHIRSKVILIRGYNNNNYNFKYYKSRRICFEYVQLFIKKQLCICI